ncbi:MAG TPA: peptidase M15 [Desulfobulbus sp.]|nr:peptidase M15 [Desulfobulbus sp.]
MSARLFPDDILFFQRLLKVEGLYTGELDGLWGPLTEKAAAGFESLSDQIQSETSPFDFRTEKNIRTLVLSAQREARIFMAKVIDADIKAKIISGTRTYAEQNRLFRQGRYGNPGPIITHARGGRSNHNFGIAWDIGIFTETGGYVAEGAVYDQAAEVGMTDTLEWGGDWTGFVDKPHYQLRFDVDLATIRQRFEHGESLTMIA